MKDLLNFRNIGLVAAILVLGAACNRPESLREQVYQGGALGTSYAFKLFSSDTTDLQPRIDSVFMVINSSLSTYLPQSDISRINHGDSTVTVDAMFRDVFEASREVHKQTRGYFDPTVGVLVDAWGFGPGPMLEMDSLRVDSLLQYVGFDKVNLSEDGRIVKAQPGIRLDFNAIAKGYAVDRLSVMLENAGISNYLLEVGGELRAKGSNQAKQKPWVVGIDDPQAETGRAIKKIITLEDISMASSGNYRKFRIDSVSGQKFVHTIDPHTGFTRNSNILATSVLAATCMDADAYATAFMAMNLEDSQAILSGTDLLEGYIIYLDPEGVTREFMTPGFEALVQ
ncbi:MAG: FAD:protein FMN transferase [Robiginitalea sp.]